MIFESAWPCCFCGGAGDARTEITHAQDPRCSAPVGGWLFVNYAGTTLQVIGGTTGEVRTAALFVAALGASSNTYAVATRTQGLPDWIGAHVRAVTFFGGVAALTVSDNLRSGITKACFYEPAVDRPC